MSCAAPTRSSRRTPVSSRGSSTLACPSDPGLSTPTGGVRGRADLPCAAGRTVHYYAHKTRPPAARAGHDAQLKVEITRVYKANFEVYGAEKLWRQLAREGIRVGRDRVARLLRALGIRGVVRDATQRTTTPAAIDDRPADLVNRQFTAREPNRLWVADLTDVPTWAGFCYAAFIIDASSRAIVGWRVATTLRPAWPWTPWRWPSGPARTRGWTRWSTTPTGQDLSVRYTQRLADQGAVAWVGSRGDSYDNALAEAANGLYKAELIGPRGPWRTASQAELATLQWVQWCNTRRLHGALNHIPPAEYEALSYRQLEQSKELV